jgi:ABC-type phosphate/phosphonate transport system substrate-binding protein
MRHSHLKGLALILSGLFLAANVAFAKNLILTSPPREKPEAGKKQYGPMADHLSKLLGKKVVYQHPGNWLNYQRDMRADKYDIVFDGPHFIAWRIQHLGHETLVRLPGTLNFYLLAKTDDSAIQSTEDLIAKKICGIPPPNLSTMSVINAYPNPVRQPVINGVRGGMGAVFKTFMSSDECRGGIVRDTFFKKKVKDADKKKVRIIHRPPPLPNQALSVSKRVDRREKNLIIQSLTLGDGVKSSQATVSRFGGKKTKAFIPANNDDYKGHNVLLEGVIFGW